MSAQSELYSKTQAEAAGLTLEILGIQGWDITSVKILQKHVGEKVVDGWLGPNTIKAFKVWEAKNQPPKSCGCDCGCVCDLGNGIQAGDFIINGVGHKPPVRVVNYLEKGGVPTSITNTDKRTKPVTQFVLHTGAETKRKTENYAQSTERVLNTRGLSTVMTMDEDGTIYQHFDPAIRAGRHASWHNAQSDSLDLGGPFSRGKTPLEGQKALDIKCAIGRTNDKKPPMSRGYATLKCWSMTPAQEAALVAFIPWYCKVRGIPLRACSDWRTFRLGGHGTKDPVTNVTGLIAHAQVSDPGKRVDGFRELIALKESSAPIVWREDLLEDEVLG